MSSVEQIKSKIDIVSLVSSYIKLEKAGANFKGKCPFHNEKTPSFFVSPERGNYYCFGCHVKGDIFTFVQEFEGLDFVGALKVLADKAGVTLEYSDRSEKTENERFYAILEQATFFFEKQLSENPNVSEYLYKRGLLEDTIKSFRIGYSPLDWRRLYEFLLSKGVNEKDMLSVGLIKQKAKIVPNSLPDSAEAGFREGTKDSFYDTFRGRIMFPINDSAGRVVGFSGRILISDDKSPKYLNSPETVLFNKSEILFGFDKAKKDIRIRDYSILVEGQMDLVMLHQVGITNTVASSGTALSTEHLTKLRRLSNRIIMAYDGDSAGFSASDRSAKLVLSLGMELKVAQMPEGKDPADMAKENVEELKNCLKNSKHIIDFYVDSLLSRGMEPRLLGKEIGIHVLPYINLLTSAIEKSHFVKSISQKTFIKEDAFWEDLKKVNSTQPMQDIKEIKQDKVVRIDSIERRIIGIIMWQKTLAEPIKSIEDLESKFINITGSRGKELIITLEKDKESLLFEMESYYNGNKSISSDVNELLSGLELEYLQREYVETMALLHKAELLRDTVQLSKYFQECQNISKKINTIKNAHEKK